MSPQLTLGVKVLSRNMNMHCLLNGLLKFVMAQVGRIFLKIKPLLLGLKRGNVLSNQNGDLEIYPFKKKTISICRLNKVEKIPV